MKAPLLPRRSSSTVARCAVYATVLLLGFAGGLRRSEIVGFDVARDQTGDGRGWIEFFP